jgi:RNA polymerase sigma-70 factor (ECF subfamily)
MTSSAGDDRERLARWVREHARVVRGYLLGLVRRTDVADDLLQETFRKAWEARERYIESGGERAYLLRIADRLAIDHSRRNNRSATTLNDDDWAALEPVAREPMPETTLLHYEQRRMLDEALTCLSEPQRRVLMMRFFGELEFAEIASQMDCPLGTVLSHCHRGLARMRKQLAEQPQ